MIIGYRRFRLQGDRKSPRLSGVYEVWSTRDEQAHCRAHDRFTTYADDLKTVCVAHLMLGQCSCGIYVLKQPDIVPDYKDYPVLAEVTAWGQYIEFERGWRVQFCRLEGLWINRRNYSLELAEELSEVYGGIPVLLEKGCCDREHFAELWPSQGGAVPICKMATSHILNAVKYMERAPSNYGLSSHKWLKEFKKELAYRHSLTEGKGPTKVVF
jgi:hypothetical protein